MNSCFLDVCKSMFNGTAECMHRNCFLAFGCFDGSLCSLDYTLIFKSGYFHYFASELSGKFFYIDFIAVLSYNIHHVDGDNYGNSEFCKLCGEVKVSFKVGTVDNV